MEINELLSQKGMSKYRLSKESGVAQTTIMDICSGKARIEKCAGDTLYRIAKALEVSMESLLEERMKEDEHMEHRASFEVFKSNVCHAVKDKGDIDFLIDTLESDEIRRLYNKQWYPEALYLLAMVDCLSRENGVPLCTKYSDIRNCKLKNAIYPASLVLSAAAMRNQQSLEESQKTAIPEFMRHNIVENEVRNVI